MNIFDQEQDIDKAIYELPKNFLDAKDGIKRLVPRLMQLEPAVFEHYHYVIRAWIGGREKVIARLINDTVIELNDNAREMGMSQPPGQEILKRSEDLALDSRLLKNKIDLVNRLGVTGERRVIGCNHVVFDSRLLPKSCGKPQALAIRNSGGFGGGKSYSVSLCLKLYPQNSYLYINSGSAKSLYTLRNGLKNKCIVLAEAFSLESKNNQDCEFAYALRNLLSEGRLSYQRTESKYGQKVTVTETVEGPTSLITTTISSKIEAQLNDRMITITPDTSSSQTRKIIERRAAAAAGNDTGVDEDTLTAWQYFHTSLKQYEVIIPFMSDIAGFFPEDRLPLSSRRAFEKITAAIKTIALLYQAQRLTDAQGRLIATHPDYYMAYQLFANSFTENLDITRKNDNSKIKIIEEEKYITLKSLAGKAGVSKPAVSKWAKPLTESGDLYWCDKDGNIFEGSEALEKAKRQGLAYLAVNRGFSLPSLFELTDDIRWDVGGEFYSQYDLQLGADGPVDELQDASVDPSSYPALSAEISDGGTITDAEKSTEVLSEPA